MIANNKTITFLLISLLSIIAIANGQASTKTPSPTTGVASKTGTPTFSPTGSRAPAFKAAGKGSKLSKKTASPVDYKASKLVASGKGMSGKGKGGKGKTYSPVAFP
ncbi:MAG: hypothetical protein SGBAC_006912 [Bacillariaceae sp.]